MNPPFSIAHRLPGDSVAVQSWLDAGATRFECDVQLIGDPADGRVVVSHFLPFLGVRGWLQHDGTHFRWGDGRSRDGRRRDPMLTDAVALLPGHAGILLDPKETDPRRRELLIDALDRAVPAGPARRERFTVSTDHDPDLAGYRSAGFASWRTVKDGAALRTFLAAGTSAHDGVSIRHSLLDPTVVDRLHGIVATVVAWTVNDPHRAATLADWGVDGITTDRRDIARSVTRGDPDDR